MGKNGSEGKRKLHQCMTACLQEILPVQGVGGSNILLLSVTSDFELFSYCKCNLGGVYTLGFPPRSNHCYGLAFC